MTGSKKEENSFVSMMKMFPDDDTLYLEAFVDDAEVVCGSPMSSITGSVKIGMTMVSSFEEAVTAGFRIATDGSNQALDKKLSEHFGRGPESPINV